MATGTTAKQIIDVVTPAAGESVSEGTILEWHVKVGDFIRATDTIVEISTDKVDLELPSPASGTITEILIEEGETVTVGQVIARIAAGEAPAGGVDLSAVSGSGPAGRVTKSDVLSAAGNGGGRTAPAQGTGSTGAAGGLADAPASAEGDGRAIAQAPPRTAPPQTQPAPAG